MIVYDTYDEAVLRAQDARERLELFVKPTEVFIYTPRACIHVGWTLEHDRVAAESYAREQGLIVSVCMLCGNTLGEKDPQGARAGLSHGLCTRCAESLKNEK